MVLIDNYLQDDGDYGVENDMQILKHQNLTRMLTFLSCDASLSAKNFIIDKDAEMKISIEICTKSASSNKIKLF